ncbi:MAG: ArdC-like ssDNA-binding domain-containing protein [Bacilli bacterium]
MNNNSSQYQKDINFFDNMKETDKFTHLQKNDKYNEEITYHFKHSTQKNEFYIHESYNVNGHEGVGDRVVIGSQNLDEVLPVWRAIQEYTREQNFRVNELPKIEQEIEIKTTTFNFEDFSKMTFEEKKAFQKEVFDDLVKRVDEISLSSLNYQQALIDYGKFENYSLYNRMLLRDQLKAQGKLFEDPVLKTYNDWKSEGVFIKKGAKAYSVIVPNHVEKYKEGEVWKKITAENKSMVKEKGFETKKFTFFNLKNVAFHISDTNSSLNIIDKGANNFQTIDFDKEGNFSSLFEAVKKSFSDEYNISENANLDSNVGGIIRAGNDGKYSIELNANSTSSMKLKTLFHEVAHAELGHLDKRIGLNHDTKELEAESTAFLFASKFGINTEISEHYLKSYSSSNNISNLFSRVFDASSSIEDKFGSSIIENINERDINQNEVADINEDDLFSNVNQMEML